MTFSLPEWMNSEARRTVIFLVISGVALALSFFLPQGLSPIDPAWISIILCGCPILKEAAEGLFTRFDIRADVLVSLALIASVIIGETFAAGEIAWIMTIGSLLEELTVEKAQAGIAELVKLSPETARLLRDGKPEMIAADDVSLNDLIQVLPGEKVPTDGVVIEGVTAIDESVMTGESIPVDKTVGDTVMSGTINRFGVFVMRATKVGKDSSVNRLIALVESADAGKTKIVRLADRWATWIVVAALSSAAVTWYITGEVVRAVTILVVFCPCALVLATPTAVMAAIGNATRKGFLVRVGDALERLAQVNQTAFDKTGTLTEGRPVVVRVVTDGKLTEEELFSYAASVEQLSEHPLGKAITKSFLARHKAAELMTPTGFTMLPGQGVRATLKGTVVDIGSLNFQKQESLFNDGQKRLIELADAAAQEGQSISFIFLDGVLSGFLSLEDKIRPFAADVVKKLLALRIEPILLTGDRKSVAEHVAAYVGIRQVIAGCLPETKLSFIEKQSEKGQKVLMVGDGINDAPALKRAHVGLAMGGIGSDIAVEAADIVAVSDRIEAIPFLIKLSRQMMTVIKINLTIAMTINFVAIVLAMGGWMGPVLGALVHNAGSVLVILHSASLLKKK